MIKMYYNNGEEIIMKPIKSLKTEMNKDIIKKAIKKFEIKEKLTNIRLRKYDNASKTMLDSYENENEMLKSMT